MNLRLKEGVGGIPLFLWIKSYAGTGLDESYCTFVYAFNEATSRDHLWQDFYKLNSRQKGPWVMMGDFNVVMNSEEWIGSNGFFEMQVEVNKALQTLIEAQIKLQQCPRSKELIMVEKQQLRITLRRISCICNFSGKRQNATGLKRGMRIHHYSIEASNKEDFRITFMLLRMDRVIWLIIHSKWLHLFWSTIIPSWGSNNNKDRGVI
ncbi:UDP-sugar pyrophosphorylase [Bienertia sinuspersici]